MLRKAIIAIVVLAWSNISGNDGMLVLRARMNELNRMWLEYKAIQDGNMLGFEPITKRSMTLLANRHKKVMQALAKQIVMELSKIDCSYCGLGNVLETRLCEGREVGSGFETTTMLPSKSAKRVITHIYDEDEDGNYIYDYGTNRYQKTRVVKYGLAKTPVQGKCAVSVSGTTGPYQGSERPGDNAIVFLDGNDAEMVLHYASKMPARVRTALRHRQDS